MKLLALLFRLSLSILVTLLVLVALAIIILPRVFDPNDYKDQLADIVKEQTQRDLSIEGDLSLSVFPRLGVSTGKLSLSQPNHLSDQFGGGNMLEVGAAKVHLKVLPLLKSLSQDKKDIQIDTIILNEPQLEIITLKNGLSSFSDLEGESGQEAHDELAEEETNTSEEKAAMAGIALVVKGVEMKSARLLWDDRKAKQRYELREFNVNTGNLLGKGLAPLKISGELIDSSTSDITQFDLEGLGRVDIESLTAILEDMQLAVERGDIVAKAKFSSLNFQQDAEIRLKDITTNIAMSDEEVGPLNIGASIPDLSFNQNSKLLLINSFNAKGEYQNQPLTADANSIQLDLTSQNFKLANIQASFAGAMAQLASLKVSSIFDDPKASAKLIVPEFDPRPVLKNLDIDFQPSNKESLQKLSLSTNFSGGMQGASLQDLVVKLDQTTITGFMKVKDYEQPKANFNLAVTELNVDHYLPETEKEQQESGAQALLVPMAVFEQFKANGKLTVGKLVAGGVKVNDIAVNVVSDDKSTTITPDAKLYDGSFDGSIKYEKKSNGGRLTVNNKLNAVNLGGLFTDANLTDQLNGIANLGINLVVEEIDGKQSNKGVISLGAKNGAVKGVDFQKMLINANNSYNELKGRELEDVSTESDETRFADLGGTFQINDYQIDNADFKMNAPLFRISGAGNIDMLKQALDYTVNVAVVNSYTGQGGESLENLKGLTLPIRLIGSLTNPSYKIDTKALLKSAFGKKVNEKKAEILKEKLGIESTEPLSSKDVLKEAFNRKLQEKYGNSEEEQPPVHPSKDNVEVVPAPEQVKSPQAQTRDVQGASVQGSSSSPEAVEEPKTKEQQKEELKQELRQKALEALFG